MYWRRKATCVSVDLLTLTKTITERPSHWQCEILEICHCLSACQRTGWIFMKFREESRLGSAINRSEAAWSIKLDVSVALFDCFPHISTETVRKPKMSQSLCRPYTSCNNNSNNKITSGQSNLIKGRIAAACTWTVFPIINNGPPLPPQNCPFPSGCGPHHYYLAHPNPQSKRHLDRFSRFAWLTTVTDKQTDRPRYTRSVTIGGI